MFDEECLDGYLDAASEVDEGDMGQMISIVQDFLSSGMDAADAGLNAAELMGYDGRVGVAVAVFVDWDGVDA